MYYSQFSANDLHFSDGATTADAIAGDVFFEILDPPELRYSFRVRPAKDFGATFVSICYFDLTENLYILFILLFSITMNNIENNCVHKKYLWVFLQFFFGF